VVGASAGGIEALRTLCGALPPDLPAAVFVVLHIGAGSLNVLPGILGRSGSLPATSAVDGEPIRQGHIYVAPADHHLFLHPESVHITRGPKEHHFRPAIDPLFRSAAAVHGARVIGVILSGTLGDGALGLRAVKNAGGLAIVQDPRDALFDSMPLRALDVVEADHCVPVGSMGALLARLCRQPLTPAGVVPSHAAWGPSTFSCPDCGGQLSQASEGAGVRFRCHVGHGFDGTSLLQAHDDVVETALYTAARVLAEKAALFRQLAGRARSAQRTLVAERFEAEAALYDERRDAVLRFFSAGGRAMATEEVGPGARKIPQRLPVGRQS
jgi:two-component system chemotaxis response regulator CheB